MLFRSQSIKSIVRHVSPRRVYCTKMVRYLDQDSAVKIDQELFKEYKFSVDQLMELAGLSCACAIAQVYSLPQMGKKSVLILCGPGNNGGDGLVCARHLSLFGYKTRFFYPKKTDNKLYQNLMHQAAACGSMHFGRIPTLKELNSDYGLIVDAVFGFSFQPPVREEFAPVIDLMKETKVPVARKLSLISVISIDIPSGWDVESGRLADDDINPEMLISLTAPKQCAQFFLGKYHYLGGRFVPKKLAEKYKLNLPPYPGTESCVILK